MPSSLLSHVARLSGAFAASSYACNTTGEGLPPTRRLLPAQRPAAQRLLAGLEGADALCITVILELGLPHLQDSDQP